MGSIGTQAPTGANPLAPWLQTPAASGFDSFSPGNALWPDTSAAAHGEQNSSVKVHGNHLERNGHEWTPRGVSLVGAIYPYPQARTQLAQQYVAARDHYDQHEMNALHSWGVDAIRLQVSQPALDPGSAMSKKSPALHRQYIQQIDQQVALARRDGFTVLLSMQDQHASGDTHASGEPDASTQRAWKTLAPKFANDTGVMYEMFNEPEAGDPALGITRPEMRTWQRTEQRTLDTIRHYAKDNVVVADAPAWASTLRDAPTLHDPDHNLAYGVHPGPRPYDKDARDWSTRFGDFATRHAVVATEYAGNPDEAHVTGVDLPKAADGLIHYSHAHDVGLYAYKFDVPGRLTQGYAHYRPTTWAHWAPMDHRSGDGTQVRQAYRAWARTTSN